MKPAADLCPAHRSQYDDWDMGAAQRLHYANRLRPINIVQIGNPTAARLRETQQHYSNKIADDIEWHLTGTRRWCTEGRGCGPICTSGHAWDHSARCGPICTADVRAIHPAADAPRRCVRCGITTSDVLMCRPGEHRPGWERLAGTCVLCGGEPDRESYRRYGR